MADTEVKSVKHAAEGKRMPWQSIIRSAVMWLLVGICCSAFSLFVIVHWVERQILTTDNWVAMVGPLPQQPVVADALGDYVTGQIFSAVPVEQKIAGALPPQADFLAGPLASQLQSITASTAKKVIASDSFQAIWIAANRIALDRVLANARGQTPPLQAKINQKFNINISDISGQLRNALGKAADAFPALQPATQQALSVTADLHARGKQLQQLIRSIDTMAATLPLLFTASLLGALALSRKRRRLLLTVLVMLAIILLIELVAVKLSRQTTLQQIRNPANDQAVAYIFDTITASLRRIVYAVLIALAVSVMILLFFGPAAWAASARNALHLSKLRQPELYKRLHVIRAWFKRWEYYLWLAAGITILAALAFAVHAINTAHIFNAVSLAITLIALIHIIGNPNRTMLRA